MSADATSPVGDDGLTGEQRRRNVVLGSLLLALVLVSIVSWMIMFSRNGFPKDPQEAKRLQALREAAQARPQGDATPAAATTSEPAAERPAR